MKIKNYLIIFILAMTILFGHSCCLAITQKAEIYFTTTDAPDPFDKNFAATEGKFDKQINLVGINFTKSKTVQIYLNDVYIGEKEIIDQKFSAKLNVPSEKQAATKTIKVVGSGKSEVVQAEILMNPTSSVPQYVWIVLALLIIGGGVYFIYRKLFQE